MTDFISAMQNIDAIAFLVLGVAIAAVWVRGRDNSAAWLALAIVTLSIVFVIGQAMTLFKISAGVLSDLNLLLFAGSAYGLLRYRASLIGLSRGWHIAGAAAIGAPAAAYFVATLASAPAAVVLWIAIALLAAWAIVVVESIVRFVLVARGLPAVQAWRLRSVSIAFAGIVLVLLVAIGMASARATSLPAGWTIAIQFAILAVVPLLYAGFSPPAWLRREWRAAEEEGLRAYMEGLLLQHDADKLDEDALGWATRLTGAAGAVSFDFQDRVRAATGMDPATLSALERNLAELRNGVERHDLGGRTRTVATMPLVGPDGTGHLVLVGGPFSPSFGREELNRVQQFMVAVTAGIEHKRLVDKLKVTNSQLKEASEHKSVFLANMSHELRTPLNAIIGFSELLLDAKETQFDAATQRRFLDQIHTSGKHLLGLINDILDLSKVEAGQMDLRLQTLEVEIVVSQVISTIEPLAGQKSITLSADVRNAGAITVDAGKLKQMLLNLLSNAIKFTPEGGSVSVAATRGPKAVDIAVTDTGIGIAKQDQPKIFREFLQLDTGPGRREQGTGLGLALTRRFAQLHGGDVSVSSELGKGSTFTLHLPIGTPEKTAHMQHSAGHGDGVPAMAPLVLVIEDDPGAAELLTRQLASGGFRTSVVRSGTDAVATARTLRPAAITLDILLPDVDGWEVMSRLKADPATSDIPVIVVSVIDNPDLGMALGALDYFVKPVDGQQLVDRLRRIKRLAQDADHAPKVLVVDDEAANRQWLSRILEPAGFNVTEAAGGQEAIDHARAAPPDVVILDLMMPKVTGFDVVEALRADRRTQDTPILILTARHLTDEDKRHLNGHVATILSRGSVGASDLVGLLRRVVDETGATAAV